MGENKVSQLERVIILVYLRIPLGGIPSVAQKNIGPSPEQVINKGFILEALVKSPRLLIDMITVEVAPGVPAPPLEAFQESKAYGGLSLCERVARRNPTYSAHRLHLKLFLLGLHLEGGEGFAAPDPDEQHALGQGRFEPPADPEAIPSEQHPNRDVLHASG
ncbi:hypothetical protein ES703_63121 [subsurface metagenome]